MFFAFKHLFGWILVLGIILGLGACVNPEGRDYRARAMRPEFLHEASRFLTHIVVYDIFKPPVACRIYAYAYLAGYEVLRNGFPAYPTLSGRLNGFKGVRKPQKGLEYCYPLAALRAFLTVGKKITFSPEAWVEFEKKFMDSYSHMGIPDDVYRRSVAFGNQAGEDILGYAQTDRFSSTRGVGYILARKPGSWEPTPPTYSDACEPLWNTIRPFTLDSAAQFFPAPPTPFDLTPGSAFYAMTREVYQISQHLTPEQKAIAYFWDDNAFVSHVSGHLMFAEKKMTPSGHWIAITQSLLKDNKKDMMASFQAYTYASIAMYDAFIGSWDVKYKTSRIRPVTVIRKVFNRDYLPFLETPGFPEYDSGHSAISSAAAVVLSHLLGNTVGFTDSTEFIYGHGVRKFKSLTEAYQEVSQSRIFGGIHFRESVNEGMRQGRNTGEWVWQKVK